MPDPRNLCAKPARRLTSREVAKVLGGLIGPGLLVMGEERMRELLRLVLEVVTVGTSERHVPIDGETDAEYMVTINALALSLTDWCGTPNVAIALTWWIEHPEALGQCDRALATFLSANPRGERGLA